MFSLSCCPTSQFETFIDAKQDISLVTKINITPDPDTEEWCENQDVQIFDFGVNIPRQSVDKQLNTLNV